MSLPSLVIAFLIGLAITLWLAFRQSRYQPMFAVGRARAHIGPLWWLGAGSAVVGGALIIVAVKGVSEGYNGLTRVEATVAAQGPSRLIIPALKVDEKIVGVPIVNDGWDISRLAFHVGWLESTGVRPGDPLAIVLIGHVTVSAAQAGPFAGLHTLKPLDEVIYRSGGVDYVYAIGSVDEVKPEDVDRLYVRKGDHLLLVTCTDWNYTTEKYEGRLIADAVLAKQVRSP